MSRGLRAFAHISGVVVAASMAMAMPVGRVNGHDRAGR